MLSNTVAMDFGRALFGSVGAIVFAVMVAVSSFGALSGSSYILTQTLTRTTQLFLYFSGILYLSANSRGSGPGRVPSEALWKA